jgi:hypothetical protein
MRSLLTEATEHLANWRHNCWRLLYGPSRARTELGQTIARTLSDGVTPWGSDPLETVWRSSQLQYLAVLEHVRAAAALLVPPFRTWSVGAEVRVAVEAAAQSCWLMDLAIPDGLTRVGRYYTTRLYASRQLEYTYKKTNPPFPISEYGKTSTDIKSEAANLGLTPRLDKKNEIIGYEREVQPKADDVVQAIIGGNGAYSLMSGFSHAEFWSLLAGYKTDMSSPLGLSSDAQEAAAEDYVYLVRTCLQSLFKPLDAAYDMFGGNALLNDLYALQMDVTRLLGP